MTDSVTDRPEKVVTAPDRFAGDAARILDRSAVEVDGRDGERTDGGVGRRHGIAERQGACARTRYIGRHAAVVQIERRLAAGHRDAELIWTVNVMVAPGVSTPLAGFVVTPVTVGAAAAWPPTGRRRW